MRALLLALLVAGLAVAGCVKPAHDAKTAAPVQAAALMLPPVNATGSLVVATLFKDRSPLADVNVTVGNLSATSDGNGEARFEKLAPGLYNVTAKKAAHRTAIAQAQVVAGQEARVEAVLEAEAGSVHSHERGLFAHRDLYTFQGRFDCSATYLIVTGDCMILVQNVSEQAGAPPPPNVTTAKNVIEFPLDATWKELVVEMNWTAPQVAVEQGMTLALEPAQAPADGHAAKYAQASGASPLKIDFLPGVKHPTATAQDMPNPNGGEVIRARAFVEGLQHNPGGTDFLGVGVAKDQTFTLLVSVFYGEPAPEGYTALH